jgi:hypothetical protein
VRVYPRLAALGTRKILIKVSGKGGQPRQSDENFLASGAEAQGIFRPPMTILWTITLRLEFLTFSRLPEIDAADKTVTTTKSSKIQKSHKLSG